LYGADAIGGVVSVISKKGEGPPTCSFTTEGGSFSTFNQRASFGGSTVNYNYQVNVDPFHTGSVPMAPLELLPPGQERSNDDSDNQPRSTKRGASIHGYLALNYVAHYTVAKLPRTTDRCDPIPFVCPPTPLQTDPTVHNSFTPGEAVVDPVNGRFVSYF